MLAKHADIKFDGSPSTGSQVVTCRQTDTGKPTETFFQLFVAIAQRQLQKKK
jgi:hypothetical protein